MPVKSVYDRYSLVSSALGSVSGVVMTASQALDCGLSRRQGRPPQAQRGSDDGNALCRGVYAAHDGDRHCRPASDGGLAVCRAQGAAIRGRPLSGSINAALRRNLTEVDVLDPGRHATRKAPSLCGSFTRPGAAVLFSRVPARHPARLPPQTTLEETVLDLADVSPTAEDAVAWAIKACQRRLSTPDRITAALAGRNRARWRRDLTDAITEVTIGVHSPLELRYLRDVERRHGLPRGDRQAVTIRRGARRVRRRAVHGVRRRGRA